MLVPCPRCGIEKDVNQETAKYYFGRECREGDCLMCPNCRQSFRIVADGFLPISFNEHAEWFNKTVIRTN